MKCLFLAAGYATRLYPLTENFPKPLLPVKGKTILDHLIDDLDTLNVIDEYIVVSNHKFVLHFLDWSKKHSQKITVVDDGTTSNETRLGAVIDIQFAIEKLSIDDDLLVMAGDNLLDFSLKGFIEYFHKVNSSMTMVYKEEDKVKIRRSAVCELDKNNRIISMEEKPENPKSIYCSPAFYIYKKEDVKCIKDAIKNGCKTDAPGSLACYFATNSKMYAYLMPGSRYDIGTLEAYNKVK